MMCEHFIHALFKGVGYKLIKSPNVDEILPKQHLFRLCRVAGKLEHEARIQVWFPREQIHTFTYLRPAKDEYGRTGTWNHTIILDKEDYEAIENPVVTVEKHFLKSMVSPPQSLEPLEIGEPKNESS